LYKKRELGEAGGKRRKRNVRKVVIELSKDERFKKIRRGLKKTGKYPKWGSIYSVSTKRAEGKASRKWEGVQRKRARPVN